MMSESQNRFDAFLEVNPNLHRYLARRPHNVLLLIQAFDCFRWHMTWKEARARAAWRAMPGYWHAAYSELLAEVDAIRRANAWGLDLGNSDRNTDLAWRICRLFNTFLVLPSDDQVPQSNVSVIH